MSRTIYDYLWDTARPRRHCPLSGAEPLKIGGAAADEPAGRRPQDVAREAPAALRVRTTLLGSPKAVVTDTHRYRYLYRAVIARPRRGSTAALTPVRPSCDPATVATVLLLL